MTYIGVLQTGDVDDALATVGNHLFKGHHIMTARHEYPIGPEERERLAKGFPIEHEPIEYEVYVEFKKNPCPACGSEMVPCYEWDYIGLRDNVLKCRKCDFGDKED